MSDDFGTLLIGLLPNLRRFAISLSRSPDLADDLVQTACANALANRDSFERGTRFDAWMLRILRNTWIDRNRRLKTEGVRVHVDDLSDLISADGLASAEDRLQLKETLEAMAQLPDDHQEVLVLVCVEELSYRDAAFVLGIPIGTVMSRLARARKKLARSVGILA